MTINEINSFDRAFLYFLSEIVEQIVFPAIYEIM